MKLITEMARSFKVSQESACEFVRWGRNVRHACEAEEGDVRNH